MIFQYQVARTKDVTKYFIILFLLTVSTAMGTTKYVSPTGSDSNPGTIDLPYLTIPIAVTNVTAGDTIYLRGGVHNYSSKITIGKSGSAGLHIKLWAYPGEKPIIDFAGIGGTSSDGFSLNKNYWHFKGLEIRNAPHNGIKISNGDYNIIESCVFHDCKNTGFHMGSSSSSSPFPSNNLILNCDSYLNYDAHNSGEDADGFGVKWNIGTGNVFRGCRAYNNSDDGWDLWMCLGTITMDSCWAFRNGIGYWSQSGFQGDGNGFKVGGSNIATPHIVRQCLSFDNGGTTGRGFDQNSNAAGHTVYNCTAYRNKNGQNFYFTNGGAHIFRNNISYAGSVNIASGTIDHNSWQGFTVTDADFMSLDTAQATAPRNSDNSLPIITLLHLATGSSMIDAGVNVGLPYSGSAPDLGVFETNANPSITITTNPAGLQITIDGTPYTAPQVFSWTSGSSHTIATSSPQGSYIFNSWSDGGAQTHTITVPSGSTTYTATFTLNSSITIATNPSGRSITVDGSSYSAPQTFTWTSGSQHTIATSSPQTSGNTQYIFSSWSDGGSQSHTMTVPSSNTTYTANFTTQYQLTVASSSTDRGTTSPSGQSWQNSGSIVSLTATSYTGYHFSGWRGSGNGSYTGTNNPASATMNGPIQDTADFAINQYTITSSAGANGSITPDGVTTINYGGSQSYTITPSFGYFVVSVLVDGSPVDSLTRYTFTNVIANHTISVSFADSQQTSLIEASTGWSLVSVPRIQLNDSAAVVFAGKFGAMFGFSPVLGDYVEAPTLAPGFGYWVYYLSGTTVTISGPAPDTLKIDVKAGWNLIGSRETEVQVVDLQLSAGSIYGSAFRYDASIGDYTETTVIPLGQGIWVYVTADCTITWPK